MAVVPELPASLADSRTSAGRSRLPPADWRYWPIAVTVSTDATDSDVILFSLYYGGDFAIRQTVDEVQSDDGLVDCPEFFECGKRPFLFR